ncbi:hypothetical protein B4129_0428 [Bacillus safensis]|nr:hypothetical protein B4129_0428 [Bacillus safensis]
MASASAEAMYLKERIKKRASSKQHFIKELKFIHHHLFF